MSHQAQRAERRQPRTRAYAKTAQSPEHVSRWVLAVAVLAGAAIFWTLAANAFTSV